MLSIDEIKKKLAVLKENPVIRKVVLFGSYARGDVSRKSDMDLVVIMKTNKRFFDRYEFCDQLYDIFNTGLDILPYTEEEFSRISHRPFIKAIIKEGIVVYESGKNREEASRWLVRRKNWTAYIFPPGIPMDCRILPRIWLTAKMTATTA